jgi:hypothetical protein
MRVWPVHSAPASTSLPAANGFRETDGEGCCEERNHKKKETKPKKNQMTKSEKSNHGSSMPSHEHRPTGKIDALCQWPPPPTISSPTRKQSSLSPNTHRKQAVAWSARLDRLAAEAHARMVKMEATLAAVEARGVLERVLAERVDEIVAAVRDCGTEKEAEPLERGSRSE